LSVEKKQTMFRLAALFFTGVSGSDRFRRSKTRQRIFSSALSPHSISFWDTCTVLVCSNLREISRYEYMIRICENLLMMMMSMLDVRPGRASTTYLCINPQTSGSTSRVHPRCGTQTSVSALLSKSSRNIKSKTLSMHLSISIGRIPIRT